MSLYLGFIKECYKVSLFQCRRKLKVMMDFVTSYLRLYRCTASIPLSSVEMLAKNVLYKNSRHILFSYWQKYFMHK